MARIRALASTGAIVAAAAFLGVTSLATTATLTPDHSAAGRSAAGAYSAWQAWKIYCVECHIGPRPPAGLNLQALDVGDLNKNGAVWEKLLLKLRNREMPPPGAPRPDEATYGALVNFIESERDRLADVNPSPGRPTLHRLNRTEYGNAIHDLLALDINVADMLPADDTGYGFDNIGDVLSVSPLLMERYLAAAGKISRLAIGDTTLAASYQTYSVPQGLNQRDHMSDAMDVGSRGGTSVRYHFPVDGEYEISVTLQRGRFDELLGMGRSASSISGWTIKGSNCSPSRPPAGANSTVGADPASTPARRRIRISRFACRSRPAIEPSLQPS